MFVTGYRGKTVDFSKNSPCHRTTVAHFFNHGKWDHKKLEDILKAAVINAVYERARSTGKPVFCIVDDTIASKTAPSLQARHPIDDAYFHYSHLKRSQDYGHQAVSVMLSCDGLVLNYTLVLYDKSRTKTGIVRDIIDELPVPPVVSYFLCDCWYTSKELVNSFLIKGFYTVAAVKTNRIIYPRGIRQKTNEFALLMEAGDKDVHIVTVGGRKYHVYRYEGPLNGIGDAVVLICYPVGAFHVAKALRAFLCTEISLSTQEILDTYLCRWPVEVFFRQAKDKLAFSQCQMRSALGIKRYWLLMSLAHYLCCTGTGRYCSFEEGYAYFQKAVLQERISYIYQCGKNNVPLEKVLACAA